VLSNAQSWTIIAAFIGALAIISTLLVAQTVSLRAYLDARFDAVNVRFDGVDQRFADVQLLPSS